MLMVLVAVAVALSSFIVSSVPPFFLFLSPSSFFAAPTFSWVDTLETCQSLVKTIFNTNPSAVPGGQQALESLDLSLQSLGGTQAAITSAREYYATAGSSGSGSNYNSPEKQQQQQQRSNAAGAYYSADGVLSPLSSSTGGSPPQRGSSNNNANNNPAGGKSQLDADTCWHLCMSLLMSAWPNVHDQCEVSVFSPEQQQQQQQGQDGLAALSSGTAMATAAALCAEVNRTFHKVLNLAMHPVYPLFCPPYLQQAQSQSSSLSKDGDASGGSASPRLLFPGAVSAEDPSGFALAYNRIFHLYATQLPVSSSALSSLYGGGTSSANRDSRDSNNSGSNNNASSSSAVDARFNRIPLAGFKALSRRTNGATLTEAEMQHSLLSMRKAAAEEAEGMGMGIDGSGSGGGAADPEALIEIVGGNTTTNNNAGSSSSSAVDLALANGVGHAQILMKLPGLRQFLRNFVIFGYTTHAWQVLRRHGYVLADPQSSPLATWANDRDEAAWLSSSSSSSSSSSGKGGAGGRRISFSNAGPVNGNNSRVNSSGVYELCLDWRSEFGVVSDKSIASPLSSSSSSDSGSTCSYFSTAYPNAVDCSLAFNRDGVKFLERLFKEQLAAQSERAHRDAVEAYTAAAAAGYDSQAGFGFGSSQAAAAAAATASSILAASASASATAAANRTWLSKESVEELFASCAPAGKHPFNARLFPDVTRHNEQGGFTMTAWLNLWRMLLVTSPETCLQALYCLGFSKSASAPGTATGASASSSSGDDDSSSSSSFTSSSNTSLLRPMLKGVLGGSVDPLDDPRQAVKVDAQRKFSGPMVKSSVRRLFVVGSRGCGKSTLVLNFTCQGRRGFEQHLATAPGTRNAGAAPAPTNVPTHFVVQPPQSEDAAAVAAGILPPTATVTGGENGASSTGANLSPAAAAFATQREEARRKALPEAFVITEWPAERLREAMEAAETQCDVLLLVAACTNESVAYLREAVSLVPDNVPTAVALTQFEPSPSVERQREMVQARNEVFALCGRVDEMLLAANTGAGAGGNNGAAAQGWDVDVFTFTSPRSVKEKPLREMVKALLLLSLDPSMDNPNTPERAERKKRQAMIRSLTKAATFIGVTAAVLGAGYAAYTRVPAFAKAIDGALDKCKEAIGIPLDSSKKKANPVAAKKTLSLMQSVGW